MTSSNDRLARRAHGAVRDRRHPEFFDIRHRALPDTADLEGQPERDLVVDDYAGLVSGAVAPAERRAGRPGR